MKLSHLFLERCEILCETQGEERIRIGYGIERTWKFVIQLLHRQRSDIVLQ